MGTGAGKQPRFPLCFLTNGGGVTEADKAQELAGWLDVDVQENQAWPRRPEIDQSTDVQPGRSDDRT